MKEKETVEKNHWDDGTLATKSESYCQLELHIDFP